MLIIIIILMTLWDYNSKINSSLFSSPFWGSLGWFFYLDQADSSGCALLGSFDKLADWVI